MRRAAIIGALCALLASEANAQESDESDRFIDEFSSESLASYCFELKDHRFDEAIREVEALSLLGPIPFGEISGDARPFSVVVSSVSGDSAFCAYRVVASSVMCGIAQEKRIDLRPAQITIAWDGDRDLAIRYFDRKESIGNAPRNDLERYARSVARGLPDVADRKYVIVVGGSPDSPDVSSVLELPNAPCYLFDLVDSNDDGHLDIAAIDPTVAQYGDRLARVALAFCGDGKGRFSERWCSTPAKRPPHLRSHHD